MAAGICTGGILFVLGVTGLMDIVYRLIPLPLVRGIQLAQGLSFALTSVKYMRKVQNFKTSKTLGDRPWLGLDGLILVIVCACFIILVNGAGNENATEDTDEGKELSLDQDPENKKGKFMKFVRNLPSAFIIFILGLILGFVRNPHLVKQISFGPSSIDIMKISKHSWKQGFIKGTIPQLPLSILNSVIAVCRLSYDLFPDKHFSTSSVAVTVGLMNITGCWFGALPSCHGAGGLAGQYKFGGRSGGCVALLGAAKLVLGLVLGGSLVAILKEFPVGVLGVLLLFAGIELALASRDMNTKEDVLVVLICTAVSLVGSKCRTGICLRACCVFSLEVEEGEKGSVFCILLDESKYSLMHEYYRRVVLSQQYLKLKRQTHRSNYRLVFTPPWLLWDLKG